MYEYHPFTPIGITNFRNSNKLFGIKINDRMRHIYSIGSSGVGKSSLLINMALDDIYKFNGVCVVDPHSDTCEAIINRIPEYRKSDLIYFDATNFQDLPSYNPLYNVPSFQRQLVASEIVSIFKKIWADSWGNRIEYILRYILLSLLEYPNATLLDIQPMLMDKPFRQKVLTYVTNPYVTSFWKSEFDLYTPSTLASTVMPILNKIGVFFSSDILRGIFGRQQSISLEQCMNEGKILICNLSKGIIGEDIASVLGSFLTTSIQVTAMRRASIPQNQRRPFFLFVDEAHNYLSVSFSTMLSEIRKFNVGLFITHQYLDQLDPLVRSAILGNVGTLIVFKVGLDDSKVMEKEFHPLFNFEDLMCLPKYHIYIKLLIDGTVSRAFSAVTYNNYQ